MYQFKCQVAEIHGEYVCQSLLLWEMSDGEEYVAGDAFRVEPAKLTETDEHGQIMELICLACARIAEKHDRTLF